MTTKEIRRQILLDEPSNQDLFHGKGHERTADALVSAIKAFKNADRAIGLDGPWGSGKSSVVGIAERKLQQTNGNGKVKFHFFTFDIWKSQGSAFRRSFLEHLVSWAHSSFPKKSPKLLEIENKIKGKVREVDSNNQLNLGLYGIGVLLTVPFLPIYVLWTKSVFDGLIVAKQENQFLSSWPMFLLYAFLAVTLLTAYVKFKSESAGGKSQFARFKLALSQTLLIGAKHYEHQKVTQHIRETDPNDFEFQSVLREILSIIQDDRSNVIVVLDNIDRLPPNEIGDYWALVRSIFSRSHSNNAAGQYSQITAIVPYDRRHIEIADKSENTDTSSLTLLRRRELFSKTFDEILNVAPPVMSNTREFFDQKIRVALPDFKDPDALFRVYLIFNMLIDRGGGKATPRQVISYINEVSGLYALHIGKVPLPTVAAYLALQDKLDEQPAALADQATIDQHLRSLAADDDLEKNLAAILFNVEPDLAFQLLLDGQIEAAANSGSPDQIVTLSKAPGFGVRINDVFVANVSAWQSSGQFATAMSNFSDLLQAYSGEGASHLKKSAVGAFADIAGISLGRDATLFQKFLIVCDPSDRRTVFENIIGAALRGLGSDKLDQAKGKQFLKFLSDIVVTVTSVDPSMQPGSTLKFVVLPPNPAFLFGFAVEAFDAPVQMSQVSKPVLDLSAEAEFLETMALTQTSECIPAFASFKKAGIVSDDQWSATSAVLATSLIDESIGLDQFHERLAVLSLTRSYISILKLKDDELNNMLADASFYRGLHAAYAEDTTDVGIAHAIFLASEIFLAGKLIQPARTQRTAAVDVEFGWFNELLTGDISLSQEQLDVLVDRLTSHLRVPRWIAYGNAHPENTLAQAIVRVACGRSPIPWIGTLDLLRLYPYIKATLGSEFKAALTKLGTKVAENDLPKITVASFQPGILVDTKDFSQSEWKRLHDRAEALLDEITADDWLGHLSTGDPTFALLVAKANSSGFLPKSTALKDALLQFVVGTLNGSITGPPRSDYDILLRVIDTGYHLDLYRAVRESLKSTSVGSLSIALQLFPLIFYNLVTMGEKSKQEKEHLIRYILRPGLEGGLKPVTDAFLALKRTTVAEFIRASDSSVQASLEPALRLFMNSQRGNYSYFQKVGELVQGKKRKSFLEKLWSADFSEETDDDDQPR